MIDNLYNTSILSLASSIPRLGKLKNPDASATIVSKLCGSKVTVYLNIKNSCVTDFSHEVKACSLGQAASSVMARNIIGSHSDELINLKITMIEMLKNDGAPPQDKWSDLKFLQPVKDYKGRHASVMLTFDAVEDCLIQFK